jgi:hypothetical protein
MQRIRIVKLLEHNETFMENVKYIVFYYLYCGITPALHDFSGNLHSCTRSSVNCVNEFNLINLEWTGLSLAARNRGIRITTAMTNLAVFIC